eukprot:TRINITY_DN42641_c0_g1_i1.p1 TRINITY_DN42641_c0_g1~~TRINITY_DN42641_c0_g1_i1.p1  ORF type:complete len:383 (+),score=27.31 TRINITY_DN42641_c0_g1_i1:26-1174(+)
MTCSMVAGLLLLVEVCIVLSLDTVTALKNGSGSVASQVVANDTTATSSSSSSITTTSSSSGSTTTTTSSGSTVTETASTSTARSTIRGGWFFDIQKPKKYEHRFRVDGVYYFSTSEKAVAVGRRLCHSTTTTTTIATVTTTTHSVGSLEYSGNLFFQVCGSWNASVLCEWQRKPGDWAPFSGTAQCSYHVCQCPQWTYTSYTVPVRIAVNSIVHYTSQSQALATGRKDCIPTTTTTTTTTTTALQPVGAVNLTRGVVTFQLCGTYFIYCDVRRQGDMHWWQFGYGTCRPDTVCECPALTDDILQQYEDHRTTTVTSTFTTSSFTATSSTMTTTASTTSMSSTTSTTNETRAIVDSKAVIVSAPCIFILACLPVFSLLIQSAS